MVTDGSLFKGGLYDFKVGEPYITTYPPEKIWQTPHKTHRIGTDLDIRTLHGWMPEDNMAEFKRTSCRNGAAPYLEGAGQTWEHFHLFFEDYDGTKLGKYCPDSL